MLIQANSHLKCGIFRVPHLPNRVQQSFVRKRGSLAVFPATACSRNSLSYTKVSSEVVEKKGSNMDNKEFLQDLPVSSSYESAMDALSSLIKSQKRGDLASIGGKYGKLERMSMYLKILDLEGHINGLKIIHVAGTKGKGSTCAFCEAILRECGFRTGLFTSPHLVDVRERFRIDGLDVSEDKFLQYFWECWYLLKEKAIDGLHMPPLFQFLTVLAFKIFISEQVEVAIIETGIGGERDSTNVIKEPIVCGITSLGMDHTEILGNTLGDIASHKAGIFKPQIPAFTTPQLSEAMEVLQQRAHELAVPLNIAPPLDHKRLDGLKLSLSGDHQFINAGLAVSLCKCWLERTRNWEKIFQNGMQEVELPAGFLRGLSTANLSGRAQVVYDVSKSNNSSEAVANSSGDLIFYLDGAHSPESMEACARWFSTAVRENNNSSSLSSASFIRAETMEDIRGNGYIKYVKESTEESDKISKQILLFNCMAVRDPEILLPRLVNACAFSGTHFSKALFVPNMSMYTKVTSGTSAIPSDISRKDLTWQFTLQGIWERIIHGTDSVVEQSCKMGSLDILAPHDFLCGVASDCNPTDNRFTCSAVIPSLPLTIKWLRDRVRENPSLRLQVLVTGSLHLVGDVLKLLRR